MNKPSKSEFKAIVESYIDNTATHAQTFDVVDNWTSYYQGKFWSVVSQARTAA